MSYENKRHKKWDEQLIVEGKIVEISERREVQTRYGKRTVADTVLEDETGEIGLSLWKTK